MEQVKSTIQKNLHHQGHLIRAVRIATGLQQSELAHLLGYSTNNSLISQIERGLQRTPRLVSVVYLLDLPDPERPPSLEPDVWGSIILTTRGNNIAKLDILNLDYLTNYVTYGWMPFEAKCVAQLNGKTFSEQLRVNPVTLSQWTLGRKTMPKDTLTLWTFERSLQLGLRDSPFLRTFQGLSNREV